MGLSQPITSSWLLISVVLTTVTTVPPVQTVGPHVATLGMKFYTGELVLLNSCLLQQCLLFCVLVQQTMLCVIPG